MKTILVCGGRDFSNYELLDCVLSVHLSGKVVGLLIHGGARGVDHLAGVWAEKNGIAVREYPADWSQGRKAGPLRNQQMLDEGKPDIVFAFPGGRGTDDMKRRARKAGVVVLEVTDRAGYDLL